MGGAVTPAFSLSMPAATGAPPEGTVTLLQLVEGPAMIVLEHLDVALDREVKAFGPIHARMWRREDRALDDEDWRVRRLGSSKTRFALEHGGFGR